MTAPSIGTPKREINYVYLSTNIVTGNLGRKEHLLLLVWRSLFLRLL
jgi:hypothetical protein